jgi:hypothetical protein
MDSERREFGGRIAVLLGDMCDGVVATLFADHPKPFCGDIATEGR